MDCWKNKVLPKLKAIFGKSAVKKAAADEIVKSFDESKDGINVNFEEKKADLQHNVVQIYDSAPSAIQVLIKEKKVSSIKKNSAGVTKLIEQLANIDFPGAKQVREGIAKVGPARLSSPLFATFDKVASLLSGAAEETPKDAPAVVEKKAATTVEKEEAHEEKERVGAEKKEEVEPATKEITALAREAAAEAAAPSEPEPAKTQEETPKA